MRLARTVAGARRASVVRQKISEQQITPTSAIVERCVGTACFDIRAGAGNKNCIANVDQPGRFTAGRFPPDIYFNDLDIIERPAGYRNRSGDARCSAGWRVDTADW